MLTRAAPGGATYFMLVGDAGDGHGLVRDAGLQERF